MNEMQMKQLSMFKEITRVCELLNIKYYMYAGSLLGCIRHGGFIPWDDDIDIVMLREDFDIFLKEGQKYFKEKFFIQYINTETNYTLGHAKVRDSNTTYIESPSKNLNINHGLYVDVFILDNYKPNLIMDKFLMIKFFLLRLQMEKYYYNPTKIKFKTKCVKFLSNILYSKLNNKEIINRMEKYALKYRNDKCEFIQGYMDFNCNLNSKVYKKEWFDNYCFKEFEGEKVRVPSQYDEVLKILYGNWKELPPEEKRVGHHDAEVIDFNKSYTEYINKK